MDEQSACREGGGFKPWSVRHKPPRTFDHTRYFSRPVGVNEGIQDWPHMVKNQKPTVSHLS